MSKRLVLLFSLMILVFSIVSIQRSKKSSVSIKNVVEEKNEINETSDSLLVWMTQLKNESQQFRDEGKIIPAMKKLSDAIETRWREPNNPEEHEKLAWIYTNRAYLYHEKQGDFLAAKKDYLWALKQFESCEPSDYLVARYVYQPLGNIYTRLGENEIAISMLEKFKRVCEENGATEALMNAYNDIGRAYMNSGKLETSVEWFKKGIELDPTDNFNIGLLYSSKCKAEAKLLDFKESLISARKSMDFLDRVMQSTDSSDYHYQAAKKYKVAVLQILGVGENHFGDGAKAHELYESSLELAEEVFPEQHRGRVRAWVELGNSYRALGQKAQAMQSYQMSLRSMFDHVSITSFTTDLKKSELIADVVLGEVLIQKAKVAHEIYREINKPSWLKISAEAYLTYFNWIEVQRSEQFEFNSKLGTANEIHKNGESALAAFMDLYHVTNEGKWIDSAFRLMDQTKAIVLAEKRGFRDLANQNPQMRDLLKEQNALKYQRSIFISAIRKAEENKETDDLDRLKKRLSVLDKESQLLDQEIRALFPAYRTQKSATMEGIAVQKLKSKLKKRDAQLLSYFLGEKWMYFISGVPGDFEFARVDVNSIQANMEAFLAELNDPNNSKSQTFAQKGNLLFDNLVGKRATQLGSNWIILPDGMLNRLPFEVLVPDVSKNGSFKQMNYLMRDHAIQYAPSAYFFAQDEVGKKAKQSFLGMAPVFKQSQSYDYLPKSVEELEAGVKQFSGVELTNENASKKQFFKKASQYDILHISTHAGTNTGENNDAWMVFSDAKSGDHRLVATELLKLDLPASLVVLNACETGSGTVFKGEGPMSLARGFLDAGSQSTITNLWKVNHESNALIMKEFYENLSETQSPSRSLIEAKRAYLSNDQVDELSAHPYYWSSAILIGTDVSVSAPEGGLSLWSWLAIGSGVALIFGFIFYRRRTRSAVAA